MESFGVSCQPRLFHEVQGRVDLLPDGASVPRACSQLHSSAAAPRAGLKSESSPLFADHPCGEKRKRSLEDEGEEDAEDEEDDEDD